MSTRKQRSTTKQKVKKVAKAPIRERVYQPMSSYKFILRDLGYNPCDFEILRRTTDNLQFTQKSTGKKLGIRI